MKSMKHLNRRTFVAAGLSAGAAAFARWDSRPETILHNGKILTMSTREREVEALAISGSRVAAFGTSKEMLELGGSGARRFDIGGKRITPGFNDAHSHPCDSGVQLVTQVALEMDSIEAVQAAIRTKAAATPPGEWVVGFLYDDTKTPRPLERADLDAAAANHPVMVRHRGGHTAFVNSRALAAVTVEENTPDPPHGTYFRDAAGRHNGRVAENAVDAMFALAVRGVGSSNGTWIDIVMGVYEQLSVSERTALQDRALLLVTPDLVRRIKAANVIPAPFACYVLFHGEKMHFYGEERLKHMFAMRDFIDAGIKAAPGSDYTASPADPMLWLRSEVTRADSTGHVWGGNQRITVEEAIRCSTVNGAYASFEEDIKGTLEPGKLADLVVWDHDLLQVDPVSFTTVKPERTMIGGRWVYEA